MNFITLATLKVGKIKNIKFPEHLNVGVYCIDPALLTMKRCEEDKPLLIINLWSNESFAYGVNHDVI